MTTRNTPNPVDVHVGAQLRKRRLICGISQTDFGARLGVSFQQVQKYESGSNRLSASRMYEAAKALGVPPAYFFEGLDSAESEATAPELSVHSVRLAAKIEAMPKKTASAVYALVTALADTGDE